MNDYDNGDLNAPVEGWAPPKTQSTWASIASGIGDTFSAIGTTANRIANMIPTPQDVERGINQTGEQVNQWFNSDQKYGPYTPRQWNQLGETATSFGEVGLPNAGGEFVRDSAEQIAARGAKIRAGRAAPPTTPPATNELDDLIRQVAAMPEADQASVVEGLPQQFRSTVTKAVADARQAEMQRLSEAFKPDTPSWAQEPPPPRENLFTPEATQRLEQITQRQGEQSALGELRGTPEGTPPPPAPPSGGAPPLDGQPWFPGMEPPPAPKGSLWSKLKDIVGDIPDFTMTSATTYDLSAPGRQLRKVLNAHPTEIPKVFQAQMRALRSQEAFDASQEAIRKSPLMPYFKLMKIDLPGITEGLAREEQIGSKYAEKVLPKSRRFNDAYTAAINEGRTFLGEYLLKQVDPALLTEAGLRNGGAQKLEELGKLINASTGRGSLPQFLQENKVLGKPLLFAPRLFAGLIQTPAKMFSENPIVRNEAIRQMASYVGTNAVILSMIKASGAGDVELDPRSSDWGQIRIGNRRFDVFAGERPIVNLMARMAIDGYDAVAPTVNKVAGTSIHEGVPNFKGINTPSGPGSLYSRGALEVMGNFLRNKLAPVPGEVVNQATGKDVVGNDVTRPIGDKGTPNIGRAEHAIGSIAPIFLSGLLEELGHTVPRGLESGGPIGAATEAAKSLASNAFYGLGGGGSYYIPNASEATRMGEFEKLSPQDQFNALRDQSWELISNDPKAPPGLDKFKSYYDWEKSIRDDLTPRVEAEARQKGIPLSTVPDVVDKQIAQEPIAKAFAKAKQFVEDKWVEENPQMAFDRWEADKDKKWNDATRWEPNAKQKAALVRWYQQTHKE